MGLYLGTILATGVNITAQAQPSLIVVSCVHCASVVSCFLFLFFFRVHCASVADCVAPRVLGFF